MSAIVSLDTWPVVRLTFQRDLPAGDVRAMLDTFDTIIKRGEPYTTVIDVSQLRSVPDATLRRHIATWLKERKAKLGQLNKGDAFVMASPLVRGALTAIDWLVPPPNPRHYAVSTQEAINWCRAQLKLSAAPVTTARM